MMVFRNIRLRFSNLMLYQKFLGDNAVYILLEEYEFVIFSDLFRFNGYVC